MTPDDLRAAYYLVLVQLLGVLEADAVAGALVERDCAARWWSWES